MPIQFQIILAIITLANVTACSVPNTPVHDAEPTTTSSIFKSDDATQGVAVDNLHIYAISNKRISKHWKHNGVLLQSWSQVSSVDTHISHLNSGVVHDGQVFAAHSNWPHPFIRNSIEVWRADKLQHLASHILPTEDSYFSWLDRHQGSWWAAFVEYPAVTQELSQRRVLELNTRVVKMDDSFNITKRYRLPVALLQRLYPMSNSGASWGPDDCLYLTGHNRSELYVMRLPLSGDTLNWIATVKVAEIEGQGIAWDRYSSTPHIYGIRRSSKEISGTRLNRADSTAAKAFAC